MPKYTFTFSKQNKNRFDQVLENLDSNDFRIVEDFVLTKNEKTGDSEYSVVIDMDSQCALTFRMGMKQLSIRRERTDEEIAQENERLDKNKIKIKVIVNDLNTDTK